MLKLIFIMMIMMFTTFFMKKNFYMLILQNTLMLFSFLMIFFIYKLNYYWMKIYYMLGTDNMSLTLIILSSWILSLSMMASTSILSKKFNKIFMIIIYLLMLILTLSFSSINILLFYIFFELSLIPVMMLIMGWGAQIDRIQASMYMIFYTLFGSLPLLMMICSIYFKMNTLMMNMLNMLNYNFHSNIFMFMILITAFLIKMPMYLLHLWLPKAHVQAPISGSMILAGIMLKLGSYGIMRCLMIYPKMFLNFNIYIIIISIMGSMYASLICLIQTDMKIIVAYSSVVHMSVLLASLMTMTYWSMMGMIMMMIAHGLCSSGLFCLVNLNYEKLKSRNLMMNKGMINLIPSMSLWWFLLCTSNFSAPPSLNLFSEMMLFNSLVLWNNSLIILLFLTAFFSASYSIYLYSFTQYGKLFKGMFNFKLFSNREFLLIISHWLPLNLLFLNLNFFL